MFGEDTAKPVERSDIQPLQLLASVRPYATLGLVLREQQLLADQRVGIDIADHVVDALAPRALRLLVEERLHAAQRQRGRVHQHQRRDPVGLLGRHHDGRLAAQRMPEQMKAVDLEPVDRRDDLVGHALHRVAGGIIEALGSDVARQPYGENRQPRRELWRDVAEVVRRAREPVHEHERQPVACTPMVNGQPHRITTERSTSPCSIL